MFVYFDYPVPKIKGLALLQDKIYVNFTESAQVWFIIEMHFSLAAISTKDVTAFSA